MKKTADYLRLFIQNIKTNPNRCFISLLIHYVHWTSYFTVKIAVNNKLTVKFYSFFYEL